MTKKIWLAVNKNGFINLFSGEPVRYEEEQKWMGKLPYINSVVYSQLAKIAVNNGITWESDPLEFEIQYAA